MGSPLIRAVALALIFLFVGVATAAAVFEYIPDSGSAPSIYDDFAFSSTANGFWHVNAQGARATIKHSILTLAGSSIELDRRLQTDPYDTVVVAKVRGLHYHKFGIGLGIWHAGTIGLEFDDDGVKCGRGTDHGWRVDIFKQWNQPSSPNWYYVGMSVKNPYPNWSSARLGKISSSKMKPVTLRCSVWDSSGRLLATDVARNPRPNAHYVALDEAFLRTWDSGNNYQVDWFYAGPPSGIPQPVSLQSIAR